MCKLCCSALLLLAALALADAFFLPVFVSKKQEPPQSAAVGNNVGWGRSPQQQQQQPQHQQSTYKDYYMPPPMQMPMASMHQFSYEPSPVIMSPYRQQMQYMEPQFHNVKLVPCMCPLTQDLIDQHTQNLASSAQQANADSTKLAPVSSSPSS